MMAENLIGFWAFIFWRVTASLDSLLLLGETDETPPDCPV